MRDQRAASARWQRLDDRTFFDGEIDEVDRQSWRVACLGVTVRNTTNTGTVINAAFIFSLLLVLYVGLKILPKMLHCVTYFRHISDISF